MSRMFKTITKTWNVFTGCSFECSYCWSRQLVKTRLAHTDKYKKCSFEPTFHPGELYRAFKPGKFVFVASMGDIAFASTDQRHAILERAKELQETRFLFQSKNPSIFTDGIFSNLPDNIYLGTTLETNLYREDISKAPSPAVRYIGLQRVSCTRRFISIEPVMDFDPEALVMWLKNLKPEIVEVGADNYKNNLPEPSWDKVDELLRALREFVPTVIEKDGLERLKGAS